MPKGGTGGEGAAGYWLLWFTPAITTSPSKPVPPYFAAFALGTPSREFRAAGAEAHAAAAEAEAVMSQLAVKTAATELG